MLNISVRNSTKLGISPSGKLLAMERSRLLTPRARAAATRLAPGRAQSVSGSKRGVFQAKPPFSADPVSGPGSGGFDVADVLGRPEFTRLVQTAGAPCAELKPE